MAGPATFAAARGARAGDAANLPMGASTVVATAGTGTGVVAEAGILR